MDSDSSSLMAKDLFDVEKQNECAHNMRDYYCAVDSDHRYLYHSIFAKNVRTARENNKTNFLNCVA